MAEKEETHGHWPQGTVEIPAGLPVTTIRLPNMITIYVGNAGLAVGANDVRLFIGDQVLNPDSKGVTVTQQLCLVMTPEYAMAVARNMLRGMEGFEAQFGKVRNIIAEPLEKTPPK